MTLMLLCGVSNVWGESYTITFSNNTKSATAITATTKAGTVIGAGTKYVNEQPFSVTGNCYYGDTQTCIRLGKSGSSAGLSIALSEVGQVYATSVVVNCMNMGGTKNKGAKIAAFNKDGQTTSDSEADDYTFNLDGTKITSIDLASDKAIYVYSITVNYSTTPVPPTPAKELVSLKVSGTPTKTAYYAGEEFDPAGLTVTGTYDDDSQEPIISDIEWTITPSGALTLGTTSVSVKAKVEEIESNSYNVSVTVTEKPVLPSYTLVTDASTLMDGDIIVLGAMTEDKKWYANAGINGKFLDSTDATCKDGILESEGAVGITLIAVDGGWNLKIGDKYINTTAAKALTFADDASTVWTISINEDGATVSAGETYGCFLYNVGSPRFLNYASATSATMLLPQIFKKEVTQTQTVTISEVGYATYSSDKALVVPTDETVFGAKVNDAGTAVALIPVGAGTVLEAGTGFIVAGNGSVTFEVSAAAGDAIEENELKGTGATSKTLVANEAYLLGAKDGKAIFSICSAGTLGANKAYLPAPSTVDANSTLGFDDATGIISVNNDATNNGAIYNLNGQKVGRDYKGIVIMNGKKT